MKKIFGKKIIFKWWHVPILLIIITVSSFLSVVLGTKGNPIPAKLDREKANTSKSIVNDVTELNPIQTLGIIVPHSNDDIVSAVKTYDYVSIGGGRNSMGGQTASPRAVQLDMREFNKILAFSTTTKEITVQSGIRWRDIQDYIDPYNLSVKVMQTYSNFTVGGSLSVNVHGRYIGLGPIILSVKSFRIILADGSLVEASPEKNQDIFYSAIGGMGGIGVIVDATLSLADNVNVERTQKLVTTQDYLSFFRNNVRDNKSTIFHNGDMYPPDFEKISAVSWSVTEKPPTTSRLIPRFQDYWKERVAWVVMSEWPWGRKIRQYLIDPVLYSGEHPVHTRNYEASYDVAELEPEDRDGSTYVLQEYFVPVENFNTWVPKMKKVFNDNDVNVINVSIRHALPDPGAKLAWARKEMFAFVVYYKQGTSEKDKEHVGVWTRQMIDQVLTVDGTYYLPYQLHATKEQLEKAYPNISEYFSIKKKYDPTNKFTNSLWDKYYDDKTDSATSTDKVSKDATYERPFAITHLSLPEWYIVYSADEYARILQEGLPSQFPFSQENYEYWRQYGIVKKLVEAEKNEAYVKDYLTVLRVIGISFSLENMIKVVYENTIGKLTEVIADNKKTPEDLFAGEVAGEYAVFIYDYPWYDFPYLSYFKKLWHVKADGSCCTLGQDIRRVERKLYLSVEYLAKSGYASLIAYATHQKFGVQDDIVCATVSYTEDEAEELLCDPHYQPFTRKLLLALEEQFDNQYFTIHDIAGNKKINITYRTKDEPIDDNNLIIYKEIHGVSGGNIYYEYRITRLVEVTELKSIYRTLREKGITIDHFYDY